MRGFSTLEILIAFSILSLTLTAVILVTVGTQTFAISSWTNHEALALAQAALEDTRAHAAQDFSTVLSTAPASTTSGALTYLTQVQVASLTDCKKIATSSVRWGDSGRPQTIEFTTLLTDLTGMLALGGDCEVNPPTGTWQSIASVTSGDGTVGATDVDTLNNTIFVSAASTSAAVSDLFIFTYNVTAHTITPRGSINTSSGFAALDAAGKYVYAANAETSNQLQVINVSSPDAPSVVSFTSLPNMTSGMACPGSSTCSAGRSIYYYNGYVYIGTSYLANLGSVPATSNNEFHIFCVADPSVSNCSAAHPKWIGSVNINHNVNAILVRGHYAYLATSNDAGELTIVDLAHLTTAPVTYDAPGAQDGLSLTLVGTTLYLGRAKGTSASPDLIPVDISTPLAPAACTSCAINVAEDVSTLAGSGTTLFAATSKNLYFITTNGTALAVTKTQAFAAAATGLDLSNNALFIPFANSQGPLVAAYTSL